MSTRTITGTIRNLRDEPFANARVVIRLETGSYTPEATYLAGSHTYITGDDGMLTATLWAGLGARYAVLLPDGSAFGFTLPEGDGALTWSEVRGLGAPPEDETVLALIDGRIAAAGGGLGGGLRSRRTLTLSNPDLAPGAWSGGEAEVSPTFLLVTASAPDPVNLRVYTAAAARDADLAADPDTGLAPEAGPHIVYMGEVSEPQRSGQLVWFDRPGTPNKLFYALKNLSEAPGAAAQLVVVELEGEPDA